MNKFSIYAELLVFLLSSHRYSWAWPKTGPSRHGPMMSEP